jgi:hypothetical protein
MGGCPTIRAGVGQDLRKVRDTAHLRGEDLGGARKTTTTALFRTHDGDHADQLRSK